ncbi:hypothetical protein BaRGS_00024434, partial [Batillaria attramentaria]
MASHSDPRGRSTFALGVSAESVASSSREVEALDIDQRIETTSIVISGENGGFCIWIEIRSSSAVTTALASCPKTIVDLFRLATLYCHLTHVVSTTWRCPVVRDLEPPK